MTSAPLSSLGAKATLLLLDQPTTAAPATLPPNFRRHRQAATSATAATVSVEATANNFIQRAELTLEFAILIEL
jgi:hypothetical protein